MASWSRIFGGAILIGTAASITSTLALGLLARAEGKGALQPVNATSHWLHGEQAAACTRADFAHTAVGYATHHAATIFWAALFAWWIAPFRPLTVSRMLQRASAMSVFAAAVDYLATPKRFTPGWEFVLSKRAMSVAYGAMAAGLAAGAMLWQRESFPGNQSRWSE